MKSLWLWLAIAVTSASVAHATIRINGNQLLSLSYDYDAASAARKASPGAQGAPRLLMSFGQGVMGRGTLPQVEARQQPQAGTVVYRIGIGLCYDIVNVALSGYTSCLVSMTGDVNQDGSVTSSDIIYMVNYVFKHGSLPGPCPAAGDVNCDGSNTSSDIIYLVNYVFKGGSAPCNVCNLIPGTWPCP